MLINCNICGYNGLATKRGHKGQRVNRHRCEDRQYTNACNQAEASRKEAHLDSLKALSTAEGKELADYLNNRIQEATEALKTASPQLSFHLERSIKEAREELQLIEAGK